VPPAVEFDGGSTPSPTIQEQGGESKVRFTANAPWSATVSQSRQVDWLTVSPTSGQAGDVVLNVKAAPNDTYDERNGAVTIKCGTMTKVFTVSQKQLDALIMSTDKIEIGSEGGSAEIKLKSNVDVSFKVAEEDADWIKASPKSRALTDRIFSFEISPNESIVPRTGHIGIEGAGQTEIVSVYQDGATPYMVLGSHEAVLGSAGGDIAIEISSNVDFTVECDDVDWITETPSGSRSSYTLHYTVAPNTTYDERSALITITNNENSLKEIFSVTQTPVDAIIVAKTSYLLTNNPSELNFNIQTNIDPIVTVSADWIKQVSPRSRALRDMEFCFDIEANPTPTEERTAVITLQSPSGTAKQEIKVTQSDADTRIVKSEFTPLVVYHITHDKEIESDMPLNMSLCNAFDCVVKNTYADGHEEFKSIMLTNRNLMTSLDPNLSMPVPPQWSEGTVADICIYNRNYYGYFMNFSEEVSEWYPSIFLYGRGKLTADGYHDEYRSLQYEIYNPQINLSEVKPEMVFSYPSYFTYGGYIPNGYNTQNQVLWKHADTWRGEYPMYQLSKVFGFTESEMKLLEKHFGKPADQIPTSAVVGMSVDQLLDIFECRDKPDPYLALPAGVYCTSPFDSHRGVWIADKKSTLAYSRTYGLLWIYPDIHYFAIISEEMEGFDGKRHFIESPADKGNFSWDYSTKIVEDNEERTVTEVTINLTKQYQWENASSEWPQHYDLSWTKIPRWDRYPFRNFKYTATNIDTLVYYKERPNLPFRIDKHFITGGYFVGNLVDIIPNKEYAGRKIKIEGPDWIECPDEIILNEFENTTLTIITKPTIDTSGKFGYVTFTLEGDNKPTQTLRVTVNSEYGTAYPVLRMNGAPCASDGVYGQLLDPKGGTIEVFISSHFDANTISVTSDADWIQPISSGPSSRAAGTDYIYRFNVLPNNTSESRKAVINCKYLDNFHSELCAELRVIQNVDDSASPDVSSMPAKNFKFKSIR
jgi:hypothetical protein